MITRILRKNKIKNSLVDPDEIFLDSKNLQNFDRQQFEGRIEKPISRKTLKFLGFAFSLIILVFGIQLVNLQVANGESYRKRSENNTLVKVNIFTERGIIYDRNMRELAWNKKDLGSLGSELQSEDKSESEVEDAIGAPTIRTYLTPGFSHVLGYVSYPAKDSSGVYWQNEFKGVAGLEKMYNDQIRGENGSKIIETDARGRIHSENIINTPERGKDLVTTIDSRIQGKLFSAIESLSEKSDFTGGAGVVMDVENGEVLAITSFPEYDSEILSLGKDRSAISKYITDERKFFLDRTLSGLYTPGSIVKPFFGLGALAEGVINPQKEILSTGSISIPNPYFPDQETVFRDWKAHGWTNMAEALAVSSDVYFYAIGGGFEDQKGMGIARLEKYSDLFGIGKKTGIDLFNEKSGVIPSPEWKAENFAGDPWRVGDTYNTSIGQYGFQVTLLEMARATAALANFGTLVTPHLVLGEDKKEVKRIEVAKEHFDVVHEGMRQAVTYGTAVALNLPYVNVAAKTGTAQIGVSKNKVNSWIVGFFPYENPKYVFTIMMEAGPSEGTVGASSIMRELLDWMSVNTPEYFE